MNLNRLAKSIRFTNNKKGFKSPALDLDKKLLLAISEICEAQEELRDGHGLDEIYYSFAHGHKEINKAIKDGQMATTDAPNKPEGFPIEIADAIIRLLDIANATGVSVKLYDFASWRWSESVDFYLLHACNLISECQSGLFVGFKTYKFTHNLQSAINLLFHIGKHFCNKLDMMEVIKQKLAYNKTRPEKHGRLF